MRRIIYRQYLKEGNEMEEFSESTVDLSSLENLENALVVAVVNLSDFKQRIEKAETQMLELLRSVEALKYDIAKTNN